MASISQKGFILWFTGLSGSGKSTLANAVTLRLAELGVDFEQLDGDMVRAELNTELSFSREDREKNILRIGYIARLLEKHGVAVLVSAISPYADVRDKVRAASKNFVEVFVNCPVEECQKRDVKGLYAKAARGEIKNFTGVSDPYEAPKNPEITVETHRLSLEQSVSFIISELTRLGRLTSMK